MKLKLNNKWMAGSEKPAGTIFSAFSKTIALLCAGTALGLGLAGCAGKNSAPVEISFSWWGNPPRHEYTLKGIEEFSALHPEITVKPEYAVWSGYEDAFEKRFNEGTSTDVMQINFDWLFKYSPDGNGFYDLNSLSDVIEFYNFTLSDLSFGTIGGKLNAIPVGFNTIIPVFNKSEFAKKGLALPNTWDDFFACAKAFKAQNKYVFGANAKHTFLLAVAWFEQTYSKKVFADNTHPNITQEETGLILDFVKRLINENVIYPGIEKFTAKDLASGKIAGAVAWCNETSSLAKAFNEIGGEGVLGNFITREGAVESGWYLKPVSMYAVRKNCPHPEQAAELVNFLLNNQDMALLQKTDKGVPASNKSLTSLMEHNALESMQYTSLMKIRFNSGNINPMLPVMENKTVNNTFASVCLDYAAGKLGRADAVKKLLEVLPKA